jgi:hypothetical protein
MTLQVEEAALAAEQGWSVLGTVSTRYRQPAS